MFKNKPTYYFVLILIVFPLALSAQSKINAKKLKKQAQQYFDNEQFDLALPLFLKLDSLEPDNFEIKYSIGACYLNSEQYKVLGIPYLEYALKNGESLVPNIIFYDLATLYHLNYQFDEAIKMLETFLTKAPKTDIYINKASYLLKCCKYAKQEQSKEKDIEITPLEYPINTINSETTPFVSADEELLFFTRTYYKQEAGIEFITKKEILVAIKKDQTYNITTIELSDDLIKSNISLAGISPDGEVLFFAIGNDLNTDLYACKINNFSCNQLIKLPDIINSPYVESSISVSPDGRTYYFSSNRPGGYGGKDIYRAVMDDNNEWSLIENLGPTINTEYDEESPMIHPDGKTLYFSSKGHNTIGNYDIFVSHNIKDNNWEYPVNLGMPINTPADDLGFVISADGNKAYFSSSKNYNEKKYDIYKAILHKTIPLTLVKGTIKGDDPKKPIKAKIRVYDKETKEIIKYVYDPNPNTGKYLMIFPPNKNYDMIVEAEGYKPQLINIFVPNQTYFYELYQEIQLKKIKIAENDTAIGQEIRVTNTFYDVYKTEISDSLIKANQIKHHKHIDELLQLVENIINTTDSLTEEKITSLATKDEPVDKSKILKERYNKLLSLVETAIEKTDSTTLQLISANAIYNDVSNKTYFYGLNNNENILTQVIIGKDTLYTLPPLNTVKPLEIKTPTIIEINKTEASPIPQPKIVDFRKTTEAERRYIYINYILFPVGKSNINPKYIPLLNDLCKIILSNDQIGIEINGYADPTGNEEKNLDLSRKRAEEVEKYLISKNIPVRRIISEGKGEIEDNKEIDYSQARRAEIKLFEIIKK